MRNLMSALPEGVGDLLDPFKPWHMDLELVLIVVVAIILVRRFPDTFNLNGIRPILHLLLAALVTWAAYAAIFVLVTRIKL